MPKSLLSRRAFLQTTTVAAGAALASNSIGIDAEPSYAAWEHSPANDRVRFGIVGVGMEGSSVLATAVALPGTECIAAADLYDGRHTLAREIVGKPIKTTRRYEELLDDKSVDAILIAVPSLAQAGRGRCARRGKGRLLRETHVAQSSRWPRHGGGGEEDRSHCADRSPAH